MLTQRAGKGYQTNDWCAKKRGNCAECFSLRTKVQLGNSSLVLHARGQRLPDALENFQRPHVPARLAQKGNIARKIAVSTSDGPPKRPGGVDLLDELAGDLFGRQEQSHKPCKITEARHTVTRQSDECEMNSARSKALCACRYRRKNTHPIAHA
jgi:hypothetical protein